MILRGRAGPPAAGGVLTLGGASTADENVVEVPVSGDWFDVITRTVGAHTDLMGKRLGGVPSIATVFEPGNVLNDLLTDTGDSSTVGIGDQELVRIARAAMQVLITDDLAVSQLAEGYTYDNVTGSFTLDTGTDILDHLDASTVADASASQIISAPSSPVGAESAAQSDSALTADELRELAARAEAGEQLAAADRLAHRADEAKAAGFPDVDVAGYADASYELQLVPSAIREWGDKHGTGPLYDETMKAVGAATDDVGKKRALRFITALLWEWRAKIEAEIADALDMISEKAVRARLADRLRSLVEKHAADQPAVTRAATAFHNLRANMAVRWAVYLELRPIALRAGLPGVRVTDRVIGGSYSGGAAGARVSYTSPSGDGLPRGLATAMRFLNPRQALDESDIGHLTAANGFDPRDAPGTSNKLALLATLAGALTNTRVNFTAGATDEEPRVIRGGKIPPSNASFTSAYADMTTFLVQNTNYTAEQIMSVPMILRALHDIGFTDETVTLTPPQPIT